MSKTILSVDEGWTIEECDVPIREFVELDNFEFDARRPVHVISLVHGIRDLPTWQFDLAEESRKFTYCMALEPVSVGWVNPIAFIIRYGCELREARVLQELTAIRHKYPAAKHSIVAHSYGTDMLARVSMKLEETYEFIFLCGAVCKEDPNSWTLKKIAKHLINDCSTRDILPTLAHALNPSQYQFTGTYGFCCPRVKDRYWECGHGAYIRPKHFSDNIFPIIAGGPMTRGTLGKGKLWMRLPFLILAAKYVIIGTAILSAIRWLH